LFGLAVGSVGLLTCGYGYRLLGNCSISTLHVAFLSMVDGHFTLTAGFDLI